MGSIEFEGWNVEVDDIAALNSADEVSRMGLVFERYPGLICASAQGNVSAYYVILSEVKSHLVCGGFNVKVETSAGEKKLIELSPNFVRENGEDITDIFE